MGKCNKIKPWLYFSYRSPTVQAVCTSLMIDQYIQLMWGGMGNLNAVTKYLATCMPYFTVLALYALKHKQANQLKNIL